MWEMSQQRSSILLLVNPARMKQLCVRRGSPQTAGTFKTPRENLGGSAQLSHWSSSGSWSTVSRAATTCLCWSDMPSPQRCASLRPRSRSGFKTDAPSGRKSGRGRNQRSSSCSTAWLLSSHIQPSIHHLYPTLHFTASAHHFSCLRHRQRFIIITHDVQLWPKWLSSMHHYPNCLQNLLANR